MFPANYYPNRWFTGSFFPHIGADLENPDLIDAVVSHLIADPLIAASVGGRVWQGTIGHGTAMPYILVTDPQDETTEGLDVLGGYLRRGTLAVKASVEDPGDNSYYPDDRARAIGRDVVRSLADADLLFLAGTLVRLRPGHHVRGEPDPDLGPTGFRVWNALVSLSYIVAGDYTD